MADYELINDTIEYDDEKIRQVKQADMEEKAKTPKYIPKEKRVDNKFKSSYFAYYDDVKLTPKDDW